MPRFGEVVCYVVLILPTKTTVWWIPKKSGYLFGGPYNTGYSIWGSILGYPYFGKPPHSHSSWIISGLASMAEQEVVDRPELHGKCVIIGCIYMYIGIMENKMETTIMGYIGVILGLYMNRIVTLTCRRTTLFLFL